MLPKKSISEISALNDAEPFALSDNRRHRRIDAWMAERNAKRILVSVDLGRSKNFDGRVVPN